MFHELKISGRQGIEKKQERPRGQLLDSKHRLLLVESQLDYSDKEMGSNIMGHLVEYERNGKWPVPHLRFSGSNCLQSVRARFLKANLKLPADENDLNSGSS